MDSVEIYRRVSNHYYALRGADDERFKQSSDSLAQSIKDMISIRSPDLDPVDLMKGERIDITPEGDLDIVDRVWECPQSVIHDDSSDPNNYLKVISQPFVVDLKAPAYSEKDTPVSPDVYAVGVNLVVIGLKVFSDKETAGYFKRVRLQFPFWYVPDSDPFHELKKQGNAGLYLPKVTNAIAKRSATHLEKLVGC